MFSGNCLNSGNFKIGEIYLPKYSNGGIFLPIHFLLKFMWNASLLPESELRQTTARLVAGNCLQIMELLIALSCWFIFWNSQIYAIWPSGDQNDNPAVVKNSGWVVSFLIIYSAVFGIWLPTWQLLPPVETDLVC